MLITLVHDLRYSLRSLARSPSIWINGVVAIALAVGAVTAVFTVVDRLIFRELPYANADRLVSVGILHPTVRQEFLFGALYESVRSSANSFDALTSFSGAPPCDITGDAPRRIFCARVEFNFLSTLGMNPIIGRNFSIDEDRQGGADVVLISNGIWRSRFGASNDVLEESIQIDGRTRQIIGVLPEDFELPTLERADVLVPQGYDANQLRSMFTGPNPPLRVFARIREGVGVAQARDELAERTDEWLAGVPTGALSGATVVFRPIRQRQLGNAGTLGWILFLSLLAVVMIACANVSNLLLVRGTGRLRERFLLGAIGASEWRLIRQSLVESSALWIVGGAVGLLVGHGAVTLAKAVAPSGIPRLDQAYIDYRVAAFVAVLSLGCAFGVALLPGAACFWRPSNTAASAKRLGRAAQGGLVVLQIGLCVVLVSGALLFVRSYWNVLSEPSGMRADGVIVAGISLRPDRYQEPTDAAAALDTLERSLAAVPGFDVVAVTDSVPPDGEMRDNGGEVWRYVSSSYFEALRIPLVAGRYFEEDDRRTNQRLVVLSELAARRQFGEDPVGERIQLTRSGPDHTVVGVVGDVKNRGIHVPTDPEYYLLRMAPDTAIVPPGIPSFYRQANFLVRTELATNRAADLIRDRFAEFDATMPVVIETAANRVRLSSSPQRFSATLLSSVAFVGTLLAGIGLYSALSFILAQRKDEMGLRIALGATRTDIVGIVLRLALRWGGVGVVLGTLVALTVTESLSSFLYGVSPRDLPTLALAVVYITLISLSAALFPAIRSSRADPMSLLRD